MCDERWLTLCVDNLLSNAIKFTRPSGKVRLTALDKGEFVMVTVADDGIGIPVGGPGADLREVLPRPQPDGGGRPGTGLGLAIAREIITKHGGKIWFECDPGQTCFIFIVPAAGRADRIMSPGK